MTEESLPWSEAVDLGDIPLCEGSALATLPRGNARSDCSLLPGGKAGRLWRSIDYYVDFRQSALITKQHNPFRREPITDGTFNDQQNHEGEVC